MTTSSKDTKYTTRYGTRIVGTRRRLQFGWVREDTYIDSIGHETPSNLHAAGWRDTSAAWSTAGNYESSCGWCYLGTGHTADAHAKSIMG